MILCLLRPMKIMKTNMKTNTKEHKIAWCSSCHQSKDRRCFEKLESGKTHTWCSKCIANFQKKLAEQPEEIDMCGPNPLKNLSDVERTQFLAGRAIMRRRIEQGDSLESAFVAALNLTSDNNAQLVDPELLGKYLKKYYYIRKKRKG